MTTINFDHKWWKKKNNYKRLAFHRYVKTIVFLIDTFQSSVPNEFSEDDIDVVESTQLTMEDK